ncbi:hypothetical protein ACJBQY_10685, partial [Streptococcus suis]
IIAYYREETIKKKVISMLSLGSIILTACSSSSAGFSFDEGYKTFHYKGNVYAVSKNEVDEDSIKRK